jgi:hypothetical protein
MIINQNQELLSHSLEETKGEWVIVIECILTKRVTLPLFIIFKGKHL